jgi:hypothetical protein
MSCQSHSSRFDYPNYIWWWSEVNCPYDTDHNYYNSTSPESLPSAYYDFKNSCFSPVRRRPMSFHTVRCNEAFATYNRLPPCLSASR